MRGSKVDARPAGRDAREALRDLAGSLGCFGYRPEDAEFLVAAALLGGHFLRSQYRRFRGVRRGRAEAALLRRLKENGHVKTVRAARRRLEALYRLHGTSFYRAIGPAGVESRSGRRARRWIKQRLLALDHYIAAESGTWLLHGQAKADCFRSLGVADDHFPLAVRARAGQRRPFPDGFPIRVEPGSPTQVWFSYAHAGASETGMLRHLDRLEPLLAALVRNGTEVGIEVLADGAVQFLRLRRAWRRWAARVERDWEEAELFALRQAVEQRRWKSLGRQSLERYAELRAAHSCEVVERRYRKWIGLGAPKAVAGPCLIQSCTYREVLLECDYRPAEALPGRS